MGIVTLSTEEYKDLLCKNCSGECTEKVDKAEETTKENGYIVFNNREQIEKYYNKNTSAYEFVENEKKLDVKFEFDLDAGLSNVYAGNIDANDIDAHNIYANNIYANNVDAHDIKSHNIDASNIDVYNINAYKIYAGNINAGNIDACDIYASDIYAHNIDAYNIDARNISYHASCIAYNSLKCKKIER